MNKILICVITLTSFLIGCGESDKVPNEAANHDDAPASVLVRTSDSSWIADTAIAKTLVSLGFVKAEDSFIYSRDMTLGDFKRSFGDISLHPVPSVAPGEWVRTATIEGNHTVLHFKDVFTHETTVPQDSAIVTISVNIELNRMSSFGIGYSIGPVHGSLLHLGAREISADVTTKFDDDMPGKRWSQWYILPDNTCLVLRVEDIARPRSKPLLPKIRKIILGETGKGYAGWTNQENSTPDALELNKYRKVLK